MIQCGSARLRGATSPRHTASLHQEILFVNGKISNLQPFRDGFKWLDPNKNHPALHNSSKTVRRYPYLIIINTQRVEYPITRRFEGRDYIIVIAFSLVGRMYPNKYL